MSPDGQSFRLDIQQLRGIAVLAVIVNHLGVSWLPGGYLGVDMFFVVSGFVITRSMLGSSDAPGSAAGFFAQFWIRRMFRLWPMLFVTVIATVAVLFTSGLASPDPLLTGLSAVLALSNIRLLIGRLDYFALDTGADWFMHTWSLAVEEQIYVVLSLVFAAVGIRRAGTSSVPRVRALVVVVSVLVAASVTFAFLPITSEVVRFYAPHTRFYQVGVGALAALFLAGRGTAALALPDSVRTVLLAAGGGGLFALFVLDPWSGRAVSLVSTLLTVIVVLAASRRHHEAGLLPGRWLGAIGDRSYSLYLVHWPAQLLTATVLASSFPRHAASVALTFVLGFAGYRLVENPTRHHWKSMRPRRATALAVGALAATFAVTALAYDRTDRAARRSAVVLPEERCDAESSSVLVVGDSHLTHAPLEPYLARATGDDCTLVGGYGIVMEVVWLDRESQGQREVRMRMTPTTWLIDAIRNAPTPPRALVVVHFLTAFLSDPSAAPASANFVATEWESSTGQLVTRQEFLALFADHLRQLASAMAERGGVLMVTSPPPDFDWLSGDIDTELCSGRLVVSRECATYRQEARISLEAHEARGGEVRGLLDGLGRELPNFVHLRLDEPFCEADGCSNFHDGKPVYKDDDHLNEAGAQMLAPLFDEVLAPVD